MTALIAMNAHGGRIVKIASDSVNGRAQKIDRKWRNTHVRKFDGRSHLVQARLECEEGWEEEKIIINKMIQGRVKGVTKELGRNWNP